MISAGDFRNGITIELDNNIYQIIEFQHVKPGKGCRICQNKTEKYQERRRSGENFPPYGKMSPGSY